MCARFAIFSLAAISALISACADDTPAPRLPAFTPPEHGFLAFAHEAEKDMPKPAPPHAKLPPVSEEFPRLFAATRGFKLGTPRDIRPTEDGMHAFFLRAGADDPRQSLYEVDLKAGRENELLTPESILGSGEERLSKEERARRERMRINTSGFTSYEATKDGSAVVVVLSGRLYAWSRKTGKAAELKTGPGAAVDPHLSPDGKRVAYVRAADVYAIPLEGGKEERITTGGTERKTHGLAEFIAQEELDRERGFWWSPDSQSILYEEADTSKVETFYISDPAHPERAPDANPYPRAGTTNATLRFGVVSAHGGATKWIDFNNAKYAYVAQVIWQKNAPPTFYALDRAERNGLLFTADPRSGKTTKLLEEHDDAWLNVDASCPQWLDDGSGFLWSTEKNGAWELGLYDKAGALKDILMKPAQGYRRLLTIDSKKHVAYVEAGLAPWAQWVAPVSLDGSAPPKIDIATDSFVTASFGDSTETYAVRVAKMNEMPRWSLHWVGKSETRDMVSLAKAPPVAAHAQLVDLGPDMPSVAMIRPSTLKSAEPHSLALVDAAYGGPGYTTVVDDESAYLRAQWIADETGAIVVSIDAKGTPYRGRAWERALLNRMGDVPLDGHVQAIAALEKKLPEIDPKRIGIYGWSFGGYLSAYAALKRPDVYRAAVIGAPPADWRDYDTAYTERYLGDPKSSAAAYDAASLLPLAETAPATTPAAMLVIHGTADDNVYFLNSLKLTSSLAKGKRPYDFVPVPGVTHQLYSPDTSGPVWAEVATFLRDRLAAP